MMRTILAVDDSRSHLGVLAQGLSQRGDLVALATDGHHALDLLAGRGFDLVLLDMVMPGLSGLEVLAEIRSNRETADLPVIMMTAQSDPSAAVQALAAGADDHVVKPFAFEELSARIQRVLGRSHRIAALKRANAALDSRIAMRAMELGDAQALIAEGRADRERLLASITALNAEVTRLRMAA